MDDTHSYVDTKLLNFVIKFEGFSSVPYVCSGGMVTIGYGHQYDKLENLTSISQFYAKQLLNKELLNFQNYVESLVTLELDNDKIYAMTSLCYNIGKSAFKNSTLLKKVNQGKHEDVPKEFLKWRLSKGKPLRGLLKRRLEEALLYCSQPFD